MAGLNQHGDRQPAVRPDAATSQDVTVTGTTARTITAFGSTTEMVRLSCTTDLYYRLGNSSVDAASGDVFLPSGTTEIVAIRKGVDTHVAAIQDTAGGKLNVTECD